MPKRPLAPGEAEILELLAATSSPAAGEVHVGDDAAVLAPGPGKLLVSTDLLVEDVHFRRATHSLDDVAWKAVAVNVSDIAAMGGEPVACVAAVSGGSGADLVILAPSLQRAGTALACPLVGGDVSSGRELVIAVTILGRAPRRGAVLRAGARVGDSIFVTGPLGGSAAGLRALAADPAAEGDLVTAHRRPTPRVAEGRAAAAAGATAMIDVSDGLGIDIDRVARASRVGIELVEVPVAPGATEAEALGGGEDYELVFTAPDEQRVASAFRRAGLLEPIRIGRAVADRAERSLGGEPFDPEGFLHRLG